MILTITLEWAYLCSPSTQETEVQIQISVGYSVKTYLNEKTDKKWKTSRAHKLRKNKGQVLEGTRLSGVSWNI